MPTVSSTVLAVSIATIRRAETAIIACQNCDPTADVPFAEVLACVIPNQSAKTRYIMSEPARCPACARDVLEHTLVELS